ARNHAGFTSSFRGQFKPVIAFDAAKHYCTPLFTKRRMDVPLGGGTWRICSFSALFVVPLSKGSIGRMGTWYDLGIPVRGHTQSASLLFSYSWKRNFA